MVSLHCVDRSWTVMVAKRHSLWMSVALTGFVQTWIPSRFSQKPLQIVSERFQNKSAGHQTDSAAPGARLLIWITRKSINEI